MAVPIQLKRCSHCKKIKSFSEFHKDKSYKDGHQSQCKKCRQNYYQAHRAEHSQYQKKYYSTIQGHLRQLWLNMLLRCNNPKSKQYKDYGGRGIQVKFACFEDFFDYVKELKTDPRGLTIDRINNDGNYEPGNIRFITMVENLQNKRHKYQTKFS